MDSTQRIIRDIKRAKIVEPGEGEKVGPCHYSKTGWAVWSERRNCTCRPTKKPKDEDAAFVAFDAWANLKG
jgi:hypothetical protein